MRYLISFIVVTLIGVMGLLIFEVIPRLISSSNGDYFLMGVFLILIVIGFVGSIIVDFFMEKK